MNSESTAKRDALLLRLARRAGNGTVNMPCKIGKFQIHAYRRSKSCHRDMRGQLEFCTSSYSWVGAEQLSTAELKALDEAPTSRHAA